MRAASHKLVNIYVDYLPLVVGTRVAVIAFRVIVNEESVPDAMLSTIPIAVTWPISMPVVGAAVAYSVYTGETFQVNASVTLKTKD